MKINVEFSSVFLRQDVSTTAFEVCLKDLPGINGQHQPLTVNYAAVGGMKLLKSLFKCFYNARN